MRLRHVQVTGLSGWAVLSVILLAGCAAPDVQSRIRQRPTAFANLSPEFQNAVLQGQLKEGMPMEAVYLAWGKPARVFTGHSAEGPTTTWVYLGTELAPQPYWAYNWGYPFYYPTTPTIHYGFTPQQYVRAEVVFVNGRVRSWRKLEPPARAPIP
jgi:hypothetical protein